jgi:hypothetical protein
MGERCGSFCLFFRPTRCVILLSAV